jgi:hypothetical protein
MGSWNKTCGLTRLHINAGKEVYVFALERVTSHERCYATAFWKPCLVPWVAEYNDYGAGENDRGPGLKVVISGVRKALLEIEQGENKYHDIPVKKEGFGVKEFYNAVREGRLSKKTYFGDEAEIDYVMMRKDCVDDLLNSWSIEDCKYNREKGDIEYFSYSYDDVVDEIPTFLAEFKRHLDDLDEVGRIMFDLSRVAENSATKYIKNFLRFDGVRYSGFASVKEVLQVLVEEDRLEEAERFLQDFIKGAMIDLLFEITRRNWAPGGHEGSQCVELDAQEMLLDVTKEAIARERAMYEDDE